MRRRRASGGRPRQVLVRLTDDEYARLVVKAGQADLTPASFLASSVEQADAGAGGGMSLSAQRAMATELMGLSRIIVRSAENVNRLTRIAHSQGAVPAEVPESLRALRGYAASLLELAQAYDPRQRLGTEPQRHDPAAGEDMDERENW